MIPVLLLIAAVLLVGAATAGPARGWRWRSRPRYDPEPRLDALREDADRELRRERLG